MEKLEGIVVGEDLGQIEYVVTREDVDRYFSAVGPYEHGGDVLPREQYAPPIMIGNDYLKLYKPKYSTVGALHSKMIMEVSGLLKVGEPIVTNGKIIDKFTKRGKTSVIILTTTVDRNQNIIVRFTITLTYIF